MHRIIHNDVITALKSYEPNSFDAVLCDPPYGLSFMAQRWDYEVPGAELWRAVLRVLKPGAPLIAFSSTRTYHRAVVEIEDAGFEIRDCLAWLYAQGFPKNLDVAKAIDKQRFDRTDILKVTKWVRETAKKKRVSNASIDAAFGFVGMAGHWTSAKSQPSVPTLEQVPTLLAALGTDDVPDDIKRLLYDLNGRKRQPGENWFKREVLGHRPGLVGSGFGQTGHGLTNAPDAVAVSAPASSLAREWEGYGTALKPSYEPAVLARKPLDGTVAENVRKWGVGAIAIDASRVGSSGGTEGSDYVKEGAGVYGTTIGGNGKISQLDAGRWPANLMLSHTPECVQTGTAERKGSGWAATGSKGSENRAMSGKNYDRDAKPDAFAPDGVEEVPVFECSEDCPVRLLDEQSGQGTSTPYRENVATGAVLPLTNRTAGGYSDAGGASRFFFCPKPSTEERELGCAHLPKRSAGEMTGGREEGSDGLDSPRSGAGRGEGARNFHPTIKPVDLMRYLARLIMPPKPGKLLVPFSGSGSEMIGARLAGWEDITGIEWKKEFVEIAEARVALAEAKPGLFEKEIRATRNQHLRKLTERFTQRNVPRVLSRSSR